MPSSPSADNDKLCSVICIPPKAPNAAIAIEFKTKAAFKGKLTSCSSNFFILTIAQIFLA